MCFVHAQKKLEDELSQLDARFEARKRKFVEDSEKFRRELKRVSGDFIIIVLDTTLSFLSLSLSLFLSLSSLFPLPSHRFRITLPRRGRSLRFVSVLKMFHNQLKTLNIRNSRLPHYLIIARHHCHDTVVLIFHLKCI